jgi:hypothetical protein
MRQAVVEVADLGVADGMQSDIVELTTSFTIGQGVEAAAQELHDFVVSQVPCSEVTLEPGRLTIDFGDMSDSCLWRGRTYAGIVTVDVDAIEGGYHVVHTYDGFTGGRATLDGTADVDWTGNERHIVTDLHIATDRGEWDVTSDRTQVFTSCDDAAAICVDIDGERDWTGPNGDFEMDIEGVHVRSIDPLPETGAYTLLTPQDKEIVLAFARQDEDTIRVSVSSGRNEVKFDVTSVGAVSEAD